jgi:hypothetical protein
MPRPLLCSVALIAAATAARAQNPYQESRATTMPAGVAGTWEGKTMVGPTDSLVTKWTLVVGPGGKSWTITFPGRAPVTGRVVATGGDSVVADAGPYPSVARPGQMVTTHSVVHIKGDQMTGMSEAKFASGDVVHAKLEATRRK